MRQNKFVFRPSLHSFFTWGGLIVVAALLSSPVVTCGAVNPEISAPETLSLPTATVRPFGGEKHYLLSKNEQNKQSSKADKEKLKQKYDKWQSLDPEEKKELRRRMNQWQKMSPQERKQYQERLKQLQQISPEERRNLKKNLERWEQLSPAEQEKIRRRYKTIFNK